MFTKPYLNTARKTVIFKSVKNVDSLENLLHLFDLFGARIAALSNCNQNVRS